MSEDLQKKLESITRQSAEATRGGASIEANVSSYGLNKDRYVKDGDGMFNIGYGETTGFSAYRDNEKIWNENTTWTDDFERASSRFDDQTYLGLGSAAGSMSDIISGTNEHQLREAREFAKNIAVGTSSKDGMGSGFTNLYLNAGYTLGIVGEIILEEAVMAGGIALGTTLGLGVGGAAVTMATAGRHVQNAGRLTKALKALTSGSKALVKKGGLKKAIQEGGETVGKKLVQANDEIASTLKKLKDMKDPAKAKVFWDGLAQGSKEFGKSLGKGALNLVPGSDAIQTVSGIVKGADAYKDLSKLGKVRKTFGAFYRDTRELNLVWSESRLEGGMVRNDLYDSMIRDAKQRYDGDIPEAERKRITSIAKENGDVTTWINAPAIYLSNRIGLGSTLKKFSPGIVNRAFTKGNVTNTVLNKKTGKIITQDFQANPLKRIFGNKGKGVKVGAKNITLGALNYTKANFAEGIQEYMQESIGHGITKRGNAQYQNKTLATHYDYIAEGLKEFNPLTGGPGTEVFLSGFLMGGMMQGPKHLLLNPINKLAKTATDHRKRKKLTDVDNKNNAAEAVKLRKAANLSELSQEASEKKYKGLLPSEISRSIQEEGVKDGAAMVQAALDSPDKFFNHSLEFLRETGQVSEEMYEASKNGDKKQFLDLQERAVASLMLKAERLGIQDDVIGYFKDSSKLEDADLIAAFETDVLRGEPQKLRTQLDTIQKQLKLTQGAIKSVRAMVNPFIGTIQDHTSLEQADEFYNYKAFEQVRNDMVFAKTSVINSAERQQGISNALSALNFANDSKGFNNLNSLLDTQGLTSQIEVLKSEISVLKSEKKSTKKLDLEVEALENLKNLRIAYENGFIKPQGEAFKKEVKEHFVKALSEVVDKTLKKSGSVQSTKTKNEAITLIIDHMELQGSQRATADFLNKLDNPKEFEKILNLRKQLLEKRFQERGSEIKSNLENYKTAVDTNKILKDIFDKFDVIIQTEDIDPLVKEGVIPNHYFDSKTGREIGNPEKVNEIKNWISKNVTEKIVEKIEKEEVEKKDSEKSLIEELKAKKTELETARQKLRIAKNNLRKDNLKEALESKEIADMQSKIDDLTNDIKGLDILQKASQDATETTSEKELLDEKLNLEKEHRVLTTKIANLEKELLSKEESSKQEREIRIIKETRAKLESIETVLAANLETLKKASNNLKHAPSNEDRKRLKDLEDFNANLDESLIKYQTPKGDVFDDVSDSFFITMNRIDLGIPVDGRAVLNVLEILNSKYELLNSLKYDVSKRASYGYSMDNVYALQEELSTDIMFIEYYIKHVTEGVPAKSREEIQKSNEGLTERGLRNVIELKEAELENYEKLNKEVDDVINEYGLEEADVVENVSDTSINTLTRIENGKPVSGYAVQKALDEFYEAYRDLIKLKTDRGARQKSGLTVDALLDYQLSLEITVELLTNYIEHHESKNMSDDLLTNDTQDEIKLKTRDEIRLQKEAQSGFTEKGGQEEVSKGVAELEKLKDRKNEVDAERKRVDKRLKRQAATARIQEASSKARETTKKTLQKDVEALTVEKEDLLRKIALKNVEPLSEQLTKMDSEIAILQKQINALEKSAEEDLQKNSEEEDDLKEDVENKDSEDNSWESLSEAQKNAIFKLYTENDSYKELHKDEKDMYKAHLKNPIESIDAILTQEDEVLDEDFQKDIASLEALLEDGTKIIASTAPNSQDLTDAVDTYLNSLGQGLDIETYSTLKTFLDAAVDSKIAKNSLFNSLQEGSYVQNKHGLYKVINKTSVKISIQRSGTEIVDDLSYQDFESSFSQTTSEYDSNVNDHTDQLDNSETNIIEVEDSNLEDSENNILNNLGC